MPFLMVAVIEQGTTSYFLSLITGVFTLSGMWQLFKGKTKPGITLLMLAVVMFMVSRHILHYS